MIKQMKKQMSWEGYLEGMFTELVVGCGVR